MRGGGGDPNNAAICRSKTRSSPLCGQQYSTTGVRLALKPIHLVPFPLRTSGECYSEGAPERNAAGRGGEGPSEPAVGEQSPSSEDKMHFGAPRAGDAI